MDFVDIASRLGVPVALLLILIYGGWKAAQWAARQIDYLKENVALPIVRAHLAHVQKLDASMDALCDVNKQQADALTKLADRCPGDPKK